MFFYVSAPDAAPDYFRVNVTNSTAVSMKWSLPPEDKRNGVIRGFKISFCKTSDCSSSPSIVDIKDSNTLLYNLGSLKPYTEYEFKILAYTVGGDGPYLDTAVTRRTHEGRMYKNIKSTEPI